MSLIACPECQQQISDQAAACPHCGFNAHAARPVKPKSKNSGSAWGGIILLGLVGFGIYIFTSSGTGHSTSPVPAPAPTPPSRTTAQRIDPRRLSADPSAYVGTNVLIFGRALNVEQNTDYTWLQFMAEVGGASSAAPESVVAMLRPKRSDALKSECYRVYGVMSGTSTMKLLLTGVEQQVPTIDAYAIEPGQRDTYGIGCIAA